MAQSSSFSESAYIPQWERSRFSVSVNSALENLGYTQPEADLREVLSAFYKIHNEYATLPGENVSVSQSKSNASQFESLMKFLDAHQELDLAARRPLEWTRIVSGIYKLPDTLKLINGRMFCIAVVLYDYEKIAADLHQAGAEWARHAKLFISLLSQELQLSKEQVMIKSILTAQGLNLWAELFGPSGQSLYETVNISDLPSEVDLLSRKALASYLANRLRYVYQKEVLGIRETSNQKTKNQNQKSGAFFMHIDGAWGSGKSTLLGFLKSELESKEKGRNWIVVDFNAWQHQRLNPPWWFLMKSVHQQAMNSLRKNGRWGKWFFMQMKELAWRMNTGTNYLIAALVTCALFVGVTYAGVVNEVEWKGLPLVQLGSFIGFLWSLTSLLRSGLVPGSSKAALKFIQEHGSDPMQALSTHFEKKCRDLGQPVAVFIDDLDRCDKDYGVQLLEGLQTIYKNAPVVFAIACDRKWLITMYENQFNLFSNIIGKPAKPFGIVFLDKIFQLSVELPSISSVHKENYWNHLLNLQQTGNGNNESLRQEIKEEIHQKATNTGKLNSLTEKDGSLRSQIKREEILTALSIGEEEKYLEHRLQKFLPLIEPNPRAMKRIINDISTVKAITFLYNQDVDEDQLILWTILKIQYPLIAEYFWNHPERLSVFQKENYSGPLIDKPELDLIVREIHTRSLFAFTIEDQTVKLDPRFLSVMKFEETIAKP